MKAKRRTLTPRQAKIRMWAYRAALAIVVLAACYGYWRKQQDPSLNKKTKTVLSSDTSLVVESGDNINIDLVGYVDGEEVENTEGKGWEVTIGVGKLIDEIESQIIGHHVGDAYTIDITFPDDYSKTELRGKEATIDLTINGKYIEVEE